MKHHGSGIYDLRFTLCLQVDRESDTNDYKNHNDAYEIYKYVFDRAVAAVNE